MQEAFIIRYIVFLLDPEDMALEMIHVLTVIQVLLTVDRGIPSLFFVDGGGNISMGCTHIQKHPGRKLERA